MKYELRGTNFEVGTAAGIETKSPKCDDKRVDGLAVDSPVAAQKITMNY